MIDQFKIEEIKNAADIEQVVRSYGVSLKRRGASLWANCPFPGHEEKTPSFCVTPAKGICKCFGCDRGGDAVSFVMQMENVSYVDAIRSLAKKYGIEVNEHRQTEEEKQRYDKRESLFAVNEFADNWFQEQMWQTDEGQTIAWQYFTNRGIREDIARQFHLGYCPDKYNEFYQAAVNAGYSEQLLTELGLVKLSEKSGKYWDFFRGRVMFPIHTASGRVIAFGGRILQKNDNVGKYFNSPESEEFYLKSKELYGLFQAKSSIRVKDHCYLCEGYMDVIAMHQNGLTDAVASCGTSLTEEQAKRISRETHNITILYDGDSAGIKAAKRAIDLLLPNDMRINVLVLPDDDDPDSFAKKHTTDEYIDFIEHRQTNWIDYLFAYSYNQDISDINRQTIVVEEFVQHLALIPDEIYRDVCVRTVAERLNISADLINRQINKQLDDWKLEVQRQQYISQRGSSDFRSSQQNVVSQETGQTPNGGQQEEHPLDEYARNILQLLLRYGDQIIKSEDISVGDYIIRELVGDNITFENQLLQQIFEEYQSGERDFLSHPNPEIQTIASQLLTDPYPLSRFFEYEDVTVELSQLSEQRKKQQKNKRGKSSVAELESAPGQEQQADNEEIVVKKMPSDADDLNYLVPHVVLEYKYKILEPLSKQFLQEIKTADEAGDTEAVKQLTAQLINITNLQRQIARFLNKVIL